jgi:putative AlgH/UPF0301 family transcriptional regulator
MRKTAVREMVDVEINNVIYMELYSAAKMADDRHRKIYVAGPVDREKSVLINSTDSLDMSTLVHDVDGYII